MYCRVRILIGLEGTGSALAVERCAKGRQSMATLNVGSVFSYDVAWQCGCKRDLRRCEAGAGAAHLLKYARGLEMDKKKKKKTWILSARAGARGRGRAGSGTGADFRVSHAQAHARVEGGEEPLFKVVPRICRLERKSDETSDQEAVVRMLCKEGRVDEAVALLSAMDEQGIEIHPRVFSSILKLCIRMKCLDKGKRVHAHIINSGVEGDIVLANMLVNMYAKCGSINTARSVFVSMPTRDVISWTALISGCVTHGYIKEAFKLFSEMQNAGVKPNRVTFVSMLNACASLGVLEEGKRIHALVVKYHLESADYVANSLVSMYAKCGSMEDARKVFWRMRDRDLISWNTMTAGYAKNGRGWEALHLFERMQKEGMSPDAYSFVSALTACASLGALKEGKQVHAVCLQSGWHSKPVVANSLIDMYSKCGSIQDARQVFDSMRKRDLVSWNSMISGYVSHGLDKEAVELFQKMAAESVKPDGVTFVSILNACGTAAALDQGRIVHAYLYKTGFEADAFVWNALIDMYAKCGSMQDAYEVFEKMPRRDVVSWNTLMAGYTQNGQPEASLKIFKRMQQEEVKPSAISFCSVIHACSSLLALEEGTRIHALLVKAGFQNDAAIRNALLEMYATCDSLKDACEVFYNLPEEIQVPPGCLDTEFWIKRGYLIRPNSASHQ